MADEKKEVIVAQAQPPATIDTGRALGLAENIGQSDMKLPRIELTQALSPTVTAGKHKAGVLVNSLTKEELVQPLLITPVFAFKNVIRWKPRAQGGGIVYRTMNITPDVAEDLRFHGDQKPQATAYINVVCLVEGQDMPLIASFCNTSYTAGQALATLIAISGYAWKYKYRISSKQRTNNQGTFYVFDVARDTVTTPEEQSKASEMFASVKGMATIDTDYEGDTTTAAPEAGEKREF
jgi:hypothetical protein